MDTNKSGDEDSIFDIKEIDSRKKLYAYLEKQPKDVSQVIAMRAALRVFPLTLLSQRTAIGQKHLFAQLTFVSFRANSISSVARKFPTNEMANAANAAVVAADATATAATAATAVAAAAAFAAFAAANAVSNTAFAGNAAFAASNAAAAAAVDAAYFNAIWESIRKDLSSLKEQQNISNIPLWHDADAPRYATNCLDGFKSQIGDEKDPWRIILDWYNALLPYDLDITPHLIFDEKIARQLAIQEPAFWGDKQDKDGKWTYDPEFDPDEAMQRVADLVGFPNHITNSPEPQNVNATQGQNQPQGSTHQNTTTQSSIDADIQLKSDSVDPDIDALERAPIALTLAGRLNQIWDQNNSDDEDLKRYGTDRGIEFEAPKWEDPFEAGFVVHIDAPWGGGKTTFIKYLTRILNPYRQEGPLPDWFKTLQDQSDYWHKYRRPWHIVDFNAWRHQHITPPWWTFWQAIYKSCMISVLFETNQQTAPDHEIGPWRRLLNILRFQRQKNHEEPKPVETTLPSPVFPFAYRVFWGRFGRWFANWLTDLSWRVFTPDIRLKIYGLIAGFAIIYGMFHFGFLNLNANGGLEAGGEESENASGNSIIAIMVALLTGGAPILALLFGIFTKGFLSGEPSADKNYQLGSGDPLIRFRKYFARSIERFRRPVLVVIDDLDRCNSDYIVELVRGMQTVLLSPRVIFVLLGDRDWIEQAFANEYKAMKGINVGIEHEFGAKFVEKAIQLSVILPEVQPDEKRQFIRHVLGLEAPKILEENSEAKEALDESDRQFEATLNIADPIEREAGTVKIMQSLKANQSIPAEIIEQRVKTYNQRATIRAATEDKAEAATQHRLEGLVSLLPPNPRQIKRIVNEIVLIQEIARVTEDVQIGSEKWQQLVRWIILSDVYPKTWYTISHLPKIADELLKDDEKSSFAATIYANQNAMEILTLNDDDYGDNWSTKAPINTETVKWLIRVMPPTSGKMLEKAKSKAPIPVSTYQI